MHDWRWKIERINDGYINTALTDTDGIDMLWNWRQGIGRFGTLRYNVGYSLTLRYKSATLPGDVPFGYRDTISVGQRDRAHGSVSWNKDSWTTTLCGTRLGSSVSAAGKKGVNAAGEAYGRRIASYLTYNLIINKRITQDLTIDLSVVNLTNNEYRYDASNTAYPFFTYYQGADPLGRRYFLGANYKF